MIRALALVAIVSALAVAGCGGDSSGETTAPTVSIPAVTAPTAPTTTAPATSTTTPTGSTTTAKGGKAYNPKAPDSATNNVPPPAGSPQAAFEKQCKKNPQACG